MARRMFGAAKELVREVKASIHQELLALGMRRRESGIYTIGLAENVDGWLGLGSVLHEGTLEINPVVGVRHMLIEKLVAELEQKECPLHSPSTIGIHLGYVMPENTYVPWFFSVGAGNQQTVQMMIGAISDWGFVYMRAHTTISAMKDRMIGGRHGVPGVGQNLMRIAAAHLLLGEEERARELVSRHVKSIEARTDDAAELFRRFAERVIDAASGGSKRQSESAL